MDDHWAGKVLQHVSQSKVELPETLRDEITRLCQIVQGLSYYEFRDLELAELADALQHCDDMDGVMELLVEVGKVCGFDHATIFLLHHGEAITFNKRVCTSLPLEWLQTYDTRRYQYLDPVVARAMKGGNPFLFSDLPDNAPIINKFWATAVEHGIGREGCCFVFDLDLNIRVGMSFSAKRCHETVVAAFEANRSDLQVLGEIACSVFVDLSGIILVDKTELTIDELRYLKRLISTTDATGAAAILHDSEMQATQRSICNRLGVGTIFQALAVVSRERWFDTLPFDSTEVFNSCDVKLDKRPPEKRAVNGDLLP